MNFILQHIHAKMDRLGLSARNRSLHIQFSDPGLNLQLTAVHIQRWLADGTVKKGVTNASGETEKIKTSGPQKANVLMDDEDHQGYRVSKMNDNE
ncbi:hypothetical protein [Acinetobacter sp. WZC-1]|uniref:hypothetical protein n=1 Tax=Acinetobacter sp. WZC-1 TaxID=3459034 RepID=UPI00403DE5A4